MRNDPLVEEMREHGREFAAKHGNDIGRMCEALRKLKSTSGRKIVHLGPKRLPQGAVG